MVLFIVQVFIATFCVNCFYDHEAIENENIPLHGYFYRNVNLIVIQFCMHLIDLMMGNHCINIIAVPVYSVDL